MLPVHRVIPRSVVTEHHSQQYMVSAHPWQCLFGRSSVEAMNDHFLKGVNVSSLASVDFEGIRFCARLGRQGRSTRLAAHGHWIYKVRKGQKKKGKLDYLALEEVTMEFLFIHISKAFLMKN